MRRKSFNSYGSWLRWGRGGANPRPLLAPEPNLGARVAERPLNRPRIASLGGSSSWWEPAPGLRPRGGALAPPRPRFQAPPVNVMPVQRRGTPDVLGSSLGASGSRPPMATGMHACVMSSSMTPTTGPMTPRSTMVGCLQVHTQVHLDPGCVLQFGSVDDTHGTREALRTYNST